MTKKPSGPLPIISLKGSPREVGVAHGKSLRPEIEHNLSIYYKRFKNETELTREQVRERAGKYLPVIQQSDIEYYEPMKGIAEGSGLDLVDIAALNVRYELMYSQYSKLGVVPMSRTDGCTAFAVLPEASENGHLLMAQNWDWIPDVKGAMLKIQGGRNVPNVLCFTEAGVAGGKIGLNSDGLGLLINGLVSDRDDWSRLRKPFHVLCWEILRSRKLEEARTLVTDGLRSCSANFILGQQSADKATAVDIESAPDRVNLIDPDHGVLSHTNHFCDPKSIGVQQVIDEEWKSTLTRFERINKLLGSHVKSDRKIAVEDGKEMLRDHDGRPDSVCRHSNPRLEEDDRYSSVLSVIMDLKTRSLWASSGTPCSNEYQHLKL